MTTIIKSKGTLEDIRLDEEEIDKTITEEYGMEYRSGMKVGRTKADRAIANTATDKAIRMIADKLCHLDDSTPYRYVDSVINLTKELNQVLRRN